MARSSWKLKDRIALFGGQIWVRYAREMPGAFGCPEISSDGD